MNYTLNDLLIIILVSNFYFFGYFLNLHGESYQRNPTDLYKALYLTGINKMFLSFLCFPTFLAFQASIERFSNLENSIYCRGEIQSFQFEQTIGFSLMRGNNQKAITYNMLYQLTIFSFQIFHQKQFHT